MAGEWKTIAADMAKRKILTSSALGVVSTYVIALWTVREAQAAIAKHGVLIEAATRNLKPNPACGLLCEVARGRRPAWRGTRHHAGRKVESQFLSDKRSCR